MTYILLVIFSIISYLSVFYLMKNVKTLHESRHCYLNVTTNITA